MKRQAHAAPNPAAVELGYESLLLITAFIWGLGFVAQRIGMESLTPFAFNAARFFVGTLALVPLIIFRKTTLTALKACIKPGIIAGLVLTVASGLQQFGLLYTTAGKGGFITGLYVVLVPIAAMIFGRKTAARTWVGVVMAVGGLFLLSVSSDFSVNKGDMIVLVGAFFWTAHIMVLDKYAPRVDPVALAAVQFIVCSMLSIALALFTEDFTLAGFKGASGAILFSGLLTIGVGYTLQALAQTKAHPARASIIMSLEAVFAALGGWLILKEQLNARELLGCVIMMAGMLVAQWPARKKIAAVEIVA